MIHGSEQLKNKIRNASPGDKSVYVNWEAISELPDEYEAVLTEIKVSREDFSNVGTNNDPSLMPKPDLMYKIAEACGISGGDNSIAEPIIENIDINPMLCKSLEDEPTIRRMKVGERVVKYGTRLQEDGTLIRSSACTIDYNVWERCCELWSKEEMYTEGYSKEGRFPPKYDNQYKRRNHFNSEMKFAHAKAETKAHLKAIRELAGLMTGYKPDHISSGSLVFAKIRRSREVLQLETAAKLSAMGSGHQPAEKPQALLFGSTTEADPVPEPDDTYEGEQQERPRDKMINAFKAYIEAGVIPTTKADTVTGVIKWLEGSEDAEKHETYWPKAIGVLRSIEAEIPESARVDHGL